MRHTSAVIRQLSFQVDPWALLMLPACILIVPLRWTLSALMAASLHELAHTLFVVLLGGKIRSVRIHSNCAVIDSWLPDSVSEFLSILSGPVASCSLWLFHPRFPEFAVCGIVHGLYNLLPILPLDGGRLLQCILNQYIPDRTDLILYGVRIFVYCLLLLTAIYAFYRRTWSIPAINAVILSTLLGKKPCKDARTRVQ